MKRFLQRLSAACVCLAVAVPALAGGNSAAITDQTYKSGKYGGGGQSAYVLANCPREYREMYRGDLYCRKPEYRVMATRSAQCPKDVWGMYRGNLYCFGRR